MASSSSNPLPSCFGAAASISYEQLKEAVKNEENSVGEGVYHGILTNGKVTTKYNFTFFIIMIVCYYYYIHTYIHTYIDFRLHHSNLKHERASFLLLNMV